MVKTFKNKTHWISHALSLLVLVFDSITVRGLSCATLFLLCIICFNSRLHFCFFHCYSIYIYQSNHQEISDRTIKLTTLTYHYYIYVCLLCLFHYRLEYICTEDHLQSSYSFSLKSSVFAISMIDCRGLAWFVIKFIYNIIDWGYHESGPGVKLNVASAVCINPQHVRRSCLFARRWPYKYVMIPLPTLF